MSTVVIVGAQWGDEGKGKIVDVLTLKADFGRPLPRRQQRRPYRSHRQRKVCAPSHPIRNPSQGHEVRHRQRRRYRPLGVAR